MKTALEEVIEIMNQCVIDLKLKHVDSFAIFEINKIIFTAEAYLAKEKQQIIDAANQIQIIGKDHLLPGEEYYNKTYNNEHL